jgi:hypothetical protein
MNHLKLILFFIFQSYFLKAQVEFEFANSINSSFIKKHASILAHDSLLGRNTGEIGQKKAAKYIQEKFREIVLDSLSNGYLQEFCLLDKKKSGEISIGNKKLKFPEDFGFLSYFNHLENVFSIEKVIKYDEIKNYENEDLNNLLIHVDNFSDIDFIEIKKLKTQKLIFILKNYNSQYFTDYNENKLIIPEKQEKPYFFINGKAFKKTIKKGNKVKITLNKNLKNNKETENVVAFIPGTDPVLKNEYLVISAHYDHLGVIKGKVYNGADDNASGTAALLEIARVFKETSKQGLMLKRSVLFICFTGEEHGLLGSEYYSKNPLVPLSKTIANFNIDMIGRFDSIKEKNQFFVYAIGSDKISMDFHNLHEKTAKSHGKLRIDYTYNDPKNKEKLYYRSDHYNFAKNGIPSIFYFGGFHEDYHQATDDIEKLNFSKIKTISELVFLTMWNLGNAD